MTWLAYLFPVFLMGCQAADPLGFVEEEPEPPATTRERLATPRQLEIMPGDGVVSVAATRHTDTIETGQIDMTILGGDLEVSAQPGGELVIHRLLVVLDDVVLSETELPPNGITLTGISLRLAEPAIAQATWQSDGDVAAAEASLDLDFDWAVLGDDGTPLPLGVQHIGAVDVTLDVASDAEGRVAVTLRAARDGELWDWAGIVELADLRVSLASIEP